MVNGEIGTLSVNGKQIGGFLNWEIKAMPAGLIPGGQRVPTKATASGFWLFEAMPEGGKVEAAFYNRAGNKLALINKADVLAFVPGSETDKLTYQEIEMVFA